MKKVNITILVILTGLLVTGCSKKTVVPEVDVSKLDAESAIAMAQSEIDEAAEVGADVSGPQAMLATARESFDKQKYTKAKVQADEAAEEARKLKQGMLAGVRGREDAQAAIDEANNMIILGRSQGGDMTEPEQILNKAREKFAAEDYAAAIALADESFNLAKQIISMLKMDTYTVGTWESSKDCLWNIAGKKSVYNDPWKWKKIYMANKDQIKNPDIIYPGQILKIPRN
jgi:nucleoid-associated protein YgaU